LERFNGLKEGERIIWITHLFNEGAASYEVSSKGKFNLNSPLGFPRILREFYSGFEQVYSLYQVPFQTDPLYLFSILNKVRTQISVILTVQGVNFQRVKRQIEISRRNNARGDSAISNIDADVTFEETSQVLQGLSRGDDSVVEMSLVIISKIPLELDSSYFHLEKDKNLALASILGMRSRLHRSHLVRTVTASDFVLNFGDPIEPGASILTSVRGRPIYFSPNDSRLEALHWLVVGASGSGKSFFTGLVLHRMITSGVQMSVIFVDHNRSFRRLVDKFGFTYAEPKSLIELQDGIEDCLRCLRVPGTMVGIELSDLDPNDKKTGIRTLLGELEIFLRSRDSFHPVYLVLDECWNFLRDEPLLVQRAFREFRKLNGAAIAITQSLSDFLTDQSGQSIFQNAPVRILLRQGEDLGPYQGALCLNSVELTKVRQLRQEKGTFSECLIKTPFLSRLGRLYPSMSEHALLRTDNLREELIAETRKIKTIERSPSCAS
jgi:hypothetical protein